MLKYKKHRFTSILTKVEDTIDILAGMAGKNRRIVSLITQQTTDLYIRVYRDADQIVDFESDNVDSHAPFIPMDLSLVEGQLCKAGFYNDKATTVSNVDITIGYTEAE
ncbi:unnamed protein product [marine sediment metagenome]|uniref:Uncharacterized protein n=1 Tax=marine sediment metagenome TaxID=412755 RepID=X1TB37_9ZZZZ